MKLTPNSVNSIYYRELLDATSVGIIYESPSEIAPSQACTKTEEQQFTLNVVTPTALSINRTGHPRNCSEATSKTLTNPMVHLIHELLPCFQHLRAYSKAILLPLGGQDAKPI